VFVYVWWCPTHNVLCFLFCFSSSCVPYVASFSGFSFLDPIGPHVIMLAWFLIPQKTLVILAAIVTIIPWLLYCCTAIKTFTRNLIEFCEITINRGVLIFVDFVIHLRLRKSKSNQIQFSHLTIACSVWNHEFKNPRIILPPMVKCTWYNYVHIWLRVQTHDDDEVYLILYIYN
jgi:hypothetical protein